MVDKHLKTFRGQNVDLIIESKSKFDETLYFSFVRKELSENKKTIIKLFLEDTAMILKVLKRNLFKWERLYEEDTKITFVWEDKSSQKLWIHFGDDSKTLTSGQTSILNLLLKHILKEKVIFSTTDKNKPKQTAINQSSQHIYKKDSNLEVMMDETTEIEGKIINETRRAILIRFLNNNKIWVPKSSIHSHFDSNDQSEQNFLIENWILKKKRLD